MTECKLLGCARPVSSLKMCHLHANRFIKGIPLDAPLGYRWRGEGCSVEGCAREFYAKEMCSLHWSRKRRGQPLDAPYHGPRGGRKAFFDWAQCGTPAQARKHLRQKIPMCEPCRRAESRRRQDGKRRPIRFDKRFWTPEEDAVIFDGSITEVAERLGRSFDSVRNRRGYIYRIKRAAA